MAWIKNSHLILKISLWLKGIFAALETAGGLFFFVYSRESIIKLVQAVTQGELMEDPRDLAANYVMNASRHLFPDTQHFIAFYLLSHGIVKLAVIAGLLKNKYWAYPASLTVFALFIIYQVYRLSFSFSLWLLVLTFFDIFIIWLVWREYRSVVK